MAETALYSIGTWNPERSAFTPDSLSVPSFNIARAQLVTAMRELRQLGYTCHRKRSDGDYDDNDPSVIIERTDGKCWKDIRRGWNR